MTRESMSWAVLPLAVLSLAACGPVKDKEQAVTVNGTAVEGATTAAPSSETLAAMLKGDGAHATLEKVVANAGLEAVLAGEGPYTVFAPADAALSAGANFTDPTLKAQGAALLRAHIVPGALTRADIASAVDRGGAEGAKMRTMSGGLLTFKRDGETLVVTAEDGATARLVDEEALAANGVVQPTDGLLVKAEAAPAG